MKQGTRLKLYNGNHLLGFCVVNTVTPTYFTICGHPEQFLLTTAEAKEWLPRSGNLSVEK